MTTPPDGLNVVVTLTTGVEIPVYYWQGDWYVGVSDDDLDVLLEPAEIVTWRAE